MNIFTRIGRFRSLLLLLLFSVAGLTNAFAQNAYDFSATVSGNTLYFKITDATNHKVEIVTPEVGYWPSGYTKPSGSIVLPQTVNNSGTDYTITSIGDWAFYDCPGLTGITFPSSVTSIASYAFRDCSNLTGVTFPSTGISIGSYAFYGSGITSLNVDGSIGERAFSSCPALANVTIGENRITTVGESAFNSSALVSLTIGANVISIGNQAFYWCDHLANITFNATNCTSMWGRFNNGQSCTLSFGNDVESVPEGAFYGFGGLSTISNWGGVKEIGTDAFEGSGLTSVTIPDAVTSLGMATFSDCTNLTSVTFGSNSDLTTTGENTCQGCTNLTTVILPSNITTIGTSSFSGCTSLNGTGITMGNITTIGSSAFSGCSGMTHFDFPNSLTTIGDNAFNGTSFTNLTINLTTINEAFKGITTLKTVTIGRDVTNIAANAFKDCTSLNDVRVLNETPIPAGNYFLDNTAEDLVIYVPAACLATYNAATGWNAYASKMQGWYGTTITGYGNSTESDHWKFIAIPYTANTLPTEIDGLIATTPANYDLYRLAPGVASTWENYKAHTEGFEFVNGQGYLYASKKDVDIVLTGAMFAGEYKDVNLAKGWNLVDNPYGQSAYIDRSYFIMNPDGDDIVPVYAYTTTAIPVCTGVVVQAVSNSDVARFTYTAPSKSSENGGLQMTLTKAGAKGSEMQDKAIVSFEKGAQLGKFIFNEDHAKLYIPQDGDDYAIAYSDGKGEIPLYFKAKETGTYTINFENDAKLENVYLIDKYEDKTIDLSENDSYTFVGSAADRPDRFVIRFENLESFENSVFAYQSGNDIIVNGEGELQIFDVMGRNIMNTMINGVQTVNVKSQGVYIFKLNEKTQKVIVR